MQCLHHVAEAGPKFGLQVVTGPAGAGLYAGRPGTGFQVKGLTEFPLPPAELPCLEPGEGDTATLSFQPQCIFFGRHVVLWSGSFSSYKGGLYVNSYSNWHLCGEIILGASYPPSCLLFLLLLLITGSGKVSSTQNRLPLNFAQCVITFDLQRPLLFIFLKQLKIQIRICI